MASLTVLICSVSSSGISMAKASSRASTSSTTASESALRSSMNEASGLTFSGDTSSCAQMISRTLVSMFWFSMLIGILLSLVRVRFLDEQAAVDAQHLAGDIARLRRGQEAHCLGHVLWAADPPE